MKKIIILTLISFVFGGLIYLVWKNQLKIEQRLEQQIRDIGSIEQEPVIIESIKEPYIKQTIMPDGHWESYCIYPKNEYGYKTKGAMIRVSSGDCKSSWRVVEVWEK